MTHFVNPSNDVDGDLVAHLVELTGGGADYSFECIGNVQVMRAPRWSAATRVGANRSSSALPAAGQEIATRPFQLVTGRVWRGTAFGGASGRTDVPKIVDWYMDGKIEIDPMITHTMPLEDINKGIRPDACGRVDPFRGHLLRRLRTYLNSSPRACVRGAFVIPGGDSQGFHRRRAWRSNKLSSRSRSFGGDQMRFTHAFRSVCDCDMTFLGLFAASGRPPVPCPCSTGFPGLTCTDENFVTKAGAQALCG